MEPLYPGISPERTPPSGGDVTWDRRSIHWTTSCFRPWLMSARSRSQYVLMTAMFSHSGHLRTQSLRMPWQNWPLCFCQERHYYTWIVVRLTLFGDSWECIDVIDICQLYYCFNVITLFTDPAAQEYLSQHIIGTRSNIYYWYFPWCWDCLQSNLV